MKQKVLSALALMALVVVGLALPTPASAAPGDNYWHANAGSSLSGVMTGGNTSIETTAAFPGFTAVGGEVLKLSYTLGEGATCIGGAPRVYATVAGNTVNSWDQRIANGVEAACEGLLSLPAGKVTALGVVWDNGQAGTITVNSLRVLGGQEFNFNDYEIAVLDTVKAPTATAPTCDKAGAVKVPQQTGVKYTSKRNVTGGVTVSATVTAEATTGYEIKQGMTTTWTFPVAKLTGPQACPTTNPTTNPTTSPSPTGSPTTTPPTVTVLNVASASVKPVAEVDDCKVWYTTPSDHVTYTHKNAIAGAFTVVGTAKAGYVFSTGQRTFEWRVTWTAPAGCTPNPAPVANSTDGGLPQTGAKVLTAAGVGGLMIAVGGIILVLLRRRRDKDAGTHREDGDTQVIPAVS